MEKVQFTCNLTESSEPFVHTWEHTIGSGRAALALRADWQRQLKRCHKDLGFQYVRFHGLLSDDMGTLVCQNEKLIYSFFNVDQIFDYLLSIGMRPFVELSFMPSTLSSGGDTVFHYKANVTPPKNLTAWATFIEKLMVHLQSRYSVKEVSQWFFEVWNEPNLKSFWTGEQKQYFEFYKKTAEAIKSVNREFKVGGPATAQNAWISDFLRYANENDVPVDFVSTHHYPTDAMGKPGDDTVTQLSLSRRDILRDQALNTYFEAHGKPVYYTEWSTSSNPFDELHDSSYSAGGIIKAIMGVQGIVQGYSYWTFSDIFEENYFSSLPFHGGFGLMNIYGVPKPSYRAFQLLHQLGNEKLKIEGHHETVDAWVTRNENTLKVLVNNWNLPKHQIKPELVEIKIENISKISAASIERIDDEHANSYQLWSDMGKPQSLTNEQVQLLDQKSSLQKQPLKAEIVAGKLALQMMVPINGVACVTLEI
ncbi:MAG: GH39 family glycosyl hydrolase [Pseudobdellovibrionaceae bacterium]